MVSALDGVWLVAQSTAQAGAQLVSQLPTPESSLSPSLSVMAHVVEPRHLTVMVIFFEITGGLNR
jgi:hypothetical protein